jgi:hypothetical protein
MTAMIQNYGFTKTMIRDNNTSKTSDIKWLGNYNGETANIDVDINDNGEKKNIHMQLNNDEILKLLGIQPVEMSLENRLKNDFLNNETVVPSPMIELPLINKRVSKSKKSKKSNKSNKSNKSKKSKKSKKRKTRTNSRSKI